MGQYEYQRRESDEYGTRGPFYLSLSFWSLVTANLVVIVCAVLKEWPLSLMVWVYFCQNVILGVFWPAKVFASSADSSYAKKVQSVSVFMPHYLTLHFVYALSLYNFFGKELAANFKYILAMAGIFLLSETVSWFAENSMNRTRPLSLARVQLFPYARSIPMQFVVGFGAISTAGSANARLSVIFFLLLKTFADVAMYMVERSHVLGNLVTDFVEKRKERTFLSEYSNSKKEQEVCGFCQRIIGRNETHYAIKEHILCADCYTRIDREREKTSGKR
jgi:hypothetical protein